MVDKEFERLLKQIQEERLFIVRYDTSLPLQRRKQSRVDPNNIYNIDPMRILFFMKEHLRTIDLFLKIDTDGDGLLSREEMKYAFEVSKGMCRYIFSLLLLSLSSFSLATAAAVPLSSIV